MILLAIRRPCSFSCSFELIWFKIHVLLRNVTRTYYVWHGRVVDSAPEKKMSKLVMDILKSAPVIHVYCNTQLTCLEFLKAQLPPWSLAAPFLREARKDAGAVNRAYLLSLDEALSRS